MRILVMGCGRVGSSVATLLMREGHEVRIMDLNPESFLRISPEYRESIAFQGDGTSQDDLRQAGITEADAFIAVSSHDTQNAMAAQMARTLFHVNRVVCRMNDPARQQMYQALGIEAVSPITYLTNNILDAVHR